MHESRKRSLLSACSDRVARLSRGCFAVLACRDDRRIRQGIWGVSILFMDHRGSRVESHATCRVVPASGPFTIIDVHHRRASDLLHVVACWRETGSFQSPIVVPSQARSYVWYILDAVQQGEQDFALIVHVELYHMASKYLTTRSKATKTAPVMHACRLFVTCQPGEPGCEHAQV